jgi:hypothetical protein
MHPAFRRKMTVLLAPATQSAAATRSANIDCLGVDHVEIALNFAAEVNTSAIGPTIALTESNDTTASNFATWSSSFSITGAADALVTAKQRLFKIDTRTRKRYLNLAITTATHTTNDIINVGALAIFERRDETPAGTAGMVGSTNDVVVVG